MARGPALTRLAAALAGGLALYSPTWAQGTAPASEIAERFAGGSEEGEAARQKALADKAAAQARKAAEARRKAEAKRRAAERQAAEASRTAAQRKADENEMLGRARAEADERRQAMLKAEEEAVNAEREADLEAKVAAEAEAALGAMREADARRQKALAERQAADAELKRLAAEAEARRQTAEAAAITRAAEIERLKRDLADREMVAQRHRQELEAERLARALAEETLAAERSRIDAERRQSVEADQARREAEAQAKANAERERQDADRRLAAAAAEREAERRRIAEAERDAEFERIMEKVRRRQDELRRGSEEALRTQPSTAPAEAQPATAEAPPTAVADDLASGRVTILLAVDGVHRSYRETANPVLCTERLCFQGAGAVSPAVALPRNVALGPGNVLGQRAGACNRSRTCVFRNVPLDGGGLRVQPVDIGTLKHDRREFRDVKADASCRLEGGRLSCQATVVGNGYRLWIVPEPLAARAGGVALEATVMDGLGARTASAGAD